MEEIVKKVTLIALILLTMTIMLASCTFSSESTSTMDQVALNTIVAETLNALGGPATQPVDHTPLVSTLTSLTSSPLPTEAISTSTPYPTDPPLAPTNTSLPCNRASFVEDVNYADNVEVAAGTSFTKIWRIKNDGSCTWDSSYVILFDSGDQMGAPATASFTSSTISPGATTDISVNLTAPATSGTYQGNFKLRSPDNTVFGVNIDGRGPFWVKIIVPAPTTVPATTTFPTLPPPPPPRLPDLIITEITYSPAAPRKGELVTVKVSTYNQGNAAAGPYTVEWYAAGPTLGCSWPVTGMVAGGGLVLTCTYTYGGWNHGYVTKAIADTENTVYESNESNNTRAQTLDVSP